MNWGMDLEIIFGILFTMLMVVGGIATFTFVILLLLRVIGNKGACFRHLNDLGFGSMFNKLKANLYSSLNLY